MPAHELTILLLALGLLLLAARTCGELARRLGQPEVMGEILAGIMLGPTLLGRFAPAAHDALFPLQGISATTLGGIQQLAVVLFMFVAGMEVDLAAVRRQGGRVALVAAGGFLVPFLLGLGAALLVPWALGGDGGWGFALFIAVAMSISALPVIARTLIDIGLYRTDIGMLVISAAILQDLIGLLAFAVVLGLVDSGAAGRPMVLTTVLLTCGFCAVMLTVGRWCIDRVLVPIQAWLSWPGGVLTFACILALLSAAFTEAIGLHAIFGAFIAGVAIGDSPHLRQRTRATIEDFVRSFFAPLFFAGIALRVDLIGNFDLGIVAAVLVLACTGKLIGCGLGARLSGLGWREVGAVAIALNSRGAMEIIFATIALQFHIIGESTFVALVITAITTSVLAGPLIQRVLQRQRTRGFLAHLGKRGFVRRLQASDRDGVISELILAAGVVDAERPRVAQAVMVQATADLGQSLTVLEATVAGLGRPRIALGLALDGIVSTGSDQSMMRVVVLLLTSGENVENSAALRSAIVSSLADPTVQRQLPELNSRTEFIALMRTVTTIE